MSKQVRKLTLLCERGSENLLLSDKLNHFSMVITSGSHCYATIAYAESGFLRRYI